MSQRKNWTQQEDKILKFLREERQQKKWSMIAQLMKSQFNLGERTGKQCRERYHNHLDSSINNAEWTRQQNNILYQLHCEYGNKWSILAQKLPGRTDNCIKNHFYSTLRKSIRRLNRLINALFKKTYKQIKTQILYKILEVADFKFKSTSKVDQQTAQFCVKIKNRLLQFQSNQQQQTAQSLKKDKLLIDDIYEFINNNKKFSKQLLQQNDFLHPKSCLNLKKTRSSSSNRSESDFSSQYSSSIGYTSSQSQSDCSYQDEQYAPKARTRAKSQIKEGDSDYAINISSKSYKSNCQSISGMMQTLKLDQSGQKKNFNNMSIDSNISIKSAQQIIPWNTFQNNNNNLNTGINYIYQNEPKVCNSKNKTQIQNQNHHQHKMDIEQNNCNFFNQQIISPIFQQNNQNYTFFEDFNFNYEIQISSPKVSSDSNKSFNQDLFS